LNELPLSAEQCRYFLILVQDIGYGDTERPASSLETAILASGFWLLTASTPISRGDIKAKPIRHLRQRGAIGEVGGGVEKIRFGTRHYGGAALN